MTSLADLPVLVGFFSYSREDDADSQGALSTLRNRIQGELRGQLGRTAKNFRLWQDKEAIASGTLWETEIKSAAAQAVFFIPIITPTAIASPYCRFELESFLAREASLGRSDLVFPLLYIDVPALDDEVRRQSNPVLSLIAQRQYFDWRDYRYLDVNSAEVRKKVAEYCKDIRNALERRQLSPEERKQQEDATTALQRGQPKPKSARADVNADSRGIEEDASRVPVLLHSERRWRVAGVLGLLIVGAAIGAISISRVLSPRTVAPKTVSISCQRPTPPQPLQPHSLPLQRRSLAL